MTKIKLSKPKSDGFTCSTVGNQGGGPLHHFFVSSVAEWKTGYDVAELIAKMKASGYGFNVWLVPGPEDTQYEINYYSPQVEGAKFLAFYGLEEARRNRG